MQVIITYVWLLFIITACSTSESPVSTKEIIHTDEAEQAETAVTNFQQLLEDYQTSYVARGAHAKAHGCVKSYFRVNETIEEKLRYGVFAMPGREYKSWIRFSNGHFDMTVSQDGNDDARGMAIKILDPPGEPMQVAANNIPTQDFLMTNSPVFFVKDIYDYNELVAAPEALVNFIFTGLNPFKWRIDELFLAKKTLTKPPVSLLEPQYYSITAYKLGPHNIKFSARPCEQYTRQTGIAQDGPDFLRKTLVKDLSGSDACFDFMVQLQMPEKNMSIEDPTIEWLESDSPFIPLAKIIIPAQQFDTPEQDNFCENLSFAPWHALEAHQPIGQFNRMRRHVYPASSGYRHAQNHVAVPDSLVW